MVEANRCHCSEVRRFLWPRAGLCPSCFLLHETDPGWEAAVTASCLSFTSSSQLCRWINGLLSTLSFPFRPVGK